MLKGLYYKEGPANRIKDVFISDLHNLSFCTIKKHTDERISKSADILISKNKILKENRNKWIKDKTKKRDLIYSFLKESFDYKTYEEVTVSEDYNLELQPLEQENGEERSEGVRF